MATPAPPSDRTLVQYLLGRLAAEDEQRLDELSICDAAFADRLAAIEHDLADAYARGELNAEDRRRWEQRYLASRAGRQELRLAQALAAREARHAQPRRVRTVTWAVAAAAVIVLAAVTAYTVTRRAGPERAQVSVSRQPAMTVAQPPAPSHETKAPPRFVAMTLVPPTRSVAETPTLRVYENTDEVRLTLKLEPNDSTRYEVTIRDVASAAAVWRSGVIDATTSDSGNTIELTVPGRIFTPKPEAPVTKRYLLDVKGLSPRGGEIVGSYPLKVVLE